MLIVETWPPSAIAISTHVHYMGSAQESSKAIMCNDAVHKHHGAIRTPNANDDVPTDRCFVWLRSFSGVYAVFCNSFMRHLMRQSSKWFLMLISEIRC